MISKVNFNRIPGFTRLNRILPLLCGGLLIGPMLRSETIFETDFTTTPPREKIKLARHSKIENGIMQIGRKEGKFYDMVEFKLKIATPFILSYRIRVLGFSQSDHHFGPVLRCVGDTAYSFGTRGGRGRGLFISKKQKILRKVGFPDKCEKMGVGQDVRMTEVELRVDSGFAEMKVDGHSLGSVPLKFLPVEKICFYAYNSNIQVDDLKVVKLETKETKDCEKTVFSADFNLGLDAVDESGKKITPVSKTTPRLVPGMDGKALAASRKNKFTGLTYNIGEIMGRNGAIMFWSSPVGRNFETIRLLDKNGKERLTCKAMNYGYAIKLIRPDGSKYDFFSRGSKYMIHPRSWNHYAVTWDKTGAIRIFRNGLPYRPNNSWEPIIGHSSGLDFSDVRKIQIAANAGSLIDNLKVFRRKVSPAEVYAEFRKNSPLDVLIPDAIVQPEDHAAFNIEFAPGGTYTRPANPGPYFTGVKGKLSLKLYPVKNKRIMDKEIKELNQPLSVDKSPVTVKFRTGRETAGRRLPGYVAD